MEKKNLKITIIKSIFIVSYYFNSNTNGHIGEHLKNAVIQLRMRTHIQRLYYTKPPAVFNRILSGALAQFFYGRCGAGVARRGPQQHGRPRRGGEQEGYSQRCLGDGGILSLAYDLLKQSLSNTNGTL